MQVIESIIIIIIIIKAFKRNAELSDVYQDWNMRVKVFEIEFIILNDFFILHVIIAYAFVRPSGGYSEF